MPSAKCTKRDAQDEVRWASHPFTRDPRRVRRSLGMTLAIDVHFADMQKELNRHG